MDMGFYSQAKFTKSKSTISYFRNLPYIKRCRWAEQVSCLFARIDFRRCSFRYNLNWQSKVLVQKVRFLKTFLKTKILFTKLFQCATLHAAHCSGLINIQICRNKAATKKHKCYLLYLKLYFAFELRLQLMDIGCIALFFMT